MKIIAIGAVTAGGKTTVVNSIKDRLPRTTSLHFDDYPFEGKVEDLSNWVSEGADVHVWDLSPLKTDIDKIVRSGEYDFLLLDYPFAYQHQMIKPYLDCCIFINTPLDIAMARRVLRDMKEATSNEIRNEMDMYLKYERIDYIQMVENHLSTCDYVIDGAKELESIINETIEIISRI